MNDFTIDELHIILFELNFVINKVLKEKLLKVLPSYFELRDKVQIMIDNYCEHEWHNHCPECNPLNIYCKKCRTYLREKRSVEG